MKLSSPLMKNYSFEYFKKIAVLARFELSIALFWTLVASLFEGAGLLLLVPLLEAAGLPLQAGATGVLAGRIETVFKAAGLPLTLPVLLGFYMLVLGIRALAARRQAVGQVIAEQKLMRSLRGELYEAITETEWLHFSKKKSSHLLHALTADVERTGEATYFFLCIIASAAFASVYLAMALRVSFFATAVALACGVGLFALLGGKTGQAGHAGEIVSASNRDFYKIIQDHLSGMRMMKAHALEASDQAKFQSASENMTRVHRTAAQRISGVVFWAQIGSAAALALLSYFFIRVRPVPFSDLLILFFLYTRLVPRMTDIQQEWQEFSSRLPAFRAVWELESDCRAHAAWEAPPSGRAICCSQGIRFKDVTFSYREEREAVLSRVNFFIPAGKITALMGSSGAGKSTLADLLMGLLTPTEGRLLVDDAVLSPSCAKSWRGRIGYVAQEPFIFNDTLRTNLLWAKPDAAVEEIWQALRLARAEEFVRRLPQQLDAVLGEHGMLLSAGERQRIALARALLRRPALLVLDEATNQLDADNERCIQEALQGLRGATTIFLITHRHSLAQIADQAYDLQNGTLQPLSLGFSSLSLS